MKGVPACRPTMGRVRCVSLRTWCLCLCGLASLAWLQGVVHLHTGSLAREEGEARTQQNRSKEGEVVEDKVDMSRDIHLVERQVEEEPEGVPWIVNSTQARLWMGERTHNCYLIKPMSIIGRCAERADTLEILFSR